MRKIKTVTFHRAHNYGAFLQSFALQKFLQNKGNDVEILDYINPKIDKMYKPFYNPYGNFLGGIKRAVRDLFYIIPMFKRYNTFNKCIKNDLLLTKKVYSVEDARSVISKDDILITGSDQVWNENLTSGLSDIYTLNFSNNYNVSYAASVGNNNFLYSNTEEYLKKLSAIDCMSVREKSTQEILNSEPYNFNCSLVLDPVFLLSKGEWETNINKRVNVKEKHKPYIFSYMLKVDNDLVEGANYLSDVTGLPVIDNELRNKGYKSRKKSIFSKNPWYFLYYLINSEYVITQSFHAAVFSIIFHKKFYVIPHKINGVRTNDLLKKFNLMDRCFNNVEDLQKKKIDTEIDWNEVDKILTNDADYSKKWLVNAVDNHLKNTKKNNK